MDESLRSRFVRDYLIKIHRREVPPRVTMETRAREALVRADILTGIEKEHRSSALTKTFMKKKKNEKTYILRWSDLSAKSAFSFLWLTSNGIARDLHR